MTTDEDLAADAAHAIWDTVEGLHRLSDSLRVRCELLAQREGMEAILGTLALLGGLVSAVGWSAYDDMNDGELPPKRLTALCAAVRRLPHVEALLEKSGSK